MKTSRSEKIEDIYLLVRWQRHRIVEGVLDSLAVLPISVHLVPDEGASRFLSYPISNVGNTWTALLKRAPLTRAELMVKRCFDIVVCNGGATDLAAADDGDRAIDHSWTLAGRCSLSNGVTDSTAGPSTSTSSGLCMFWRMALW